MREISTKNIEIGEHVLIDGVEYVAEEGCCYDCPFGKSITCPCVPFCHVGGKLTKVEEKHDKDTPMTQHELAEWLAKGNGQYKFRFSNAEFSFWIVVEDEEDSAVDDNILIRPWGTDEWVKPTVEIYERDCRK